MFLFALQEGSSWSGTTQQIHDRSYSLWQSMNVGNEGIVWNQRVAYRCPFGKNIGIGLVPSCTIYTFWVSPLLINKFSQQRASQTKRRHRYFTLVDRVDRSFNFGAKWSTLDSSDSAGSYPLGWEGSSIGETIAVICHYDDNEELKETPFSTDRIQKVSSGSTPFSTKRIQKVSGGSTRNQSSCFGLDHWIMKHNITMGKTSLQNH